MALAREEKMPPGASLEPDDAESGLFGPGKATILRSEFANFKYGAQATMAVPVWLITYERGEEKYEQPYSIGDGWKVGPDGNSIHGVAGQTSLRDTCNATKYLTKPLQECGFPKGRFGNSPRSLEGTEVILDRVAQERREGLPVGMLGGKPSTREKTILMPVKILAYPWDSSNGATPTAKTSTKSAKPAQEEEEEEEEEQPRKAAPKKTKKAEQDAKEDAVEALVEALERSDDNELGIDEIPRAVKKLVKGKDNAEEILELVGNEEFLAEELGWTFNRKKGLVATT